MEQNAENAAPDIVAANDNPAGAEGQATDSSESPGAISSEVIKPDAWIGNPAYFQTGKKAGKPKPAARDATQFDGLNLDDLKASGPSATGPAPAAPGAPDRKTAKAEKKIVEAKIAAKLVMRSLDMVTSWISGGTYGADFNDKQAKDRNKYRDELEQDWQDYLATLDMPMHPALVAILGSVMYVAPALETAKGKERAQTFREKIVSKIAVGIFARKI